MTDVKTVPVFCNQAVDECCHQDPAKISPNAKPEATSKRHEMFRSTGDFRFALFRMKTTRLEPFVALFFILIFYLQLVK